MQQKRTKARELLSQFGAGMLITRRQNGDMHARPMLVGHASEERVITFIATLDSEKVDEIYADKHVAVTFQHGSVFLALAGTARVVTEPRLLEAMWRKEHDAWFEGPDDPNAALIEVDVHFVEYWDESGLNGVRYAVRAMAAAVSGKTPPDPPIDEHGKIRPVLGH